MKLCSKKLSGRVLELYTPSIKTEFEINGDADFVNLNYIHSKKADQYMECKIRLLYKGQNNYVELKETKYSVEDLLNMDMTIDMDTGKITGKIEKRK